MFTRTASSSASFTLISQRTFQSSAYVGRPGSTLSFRPQFKQAAIRFLDAGARGSVSVIQFNEKVKALTGFTTVETRRRTRSIKS